MPAIPERTRWIVRYDTMMVLERVAHRVFVQIRTQSPTVS
jgi:hypothetical protein